MPDNVVHDMSNQDDIGHKEYTKFVAEGVSEGKVNIWSRMQKIKLHTWKAAQKVVKHKLASQVIKLKEDTHHLPVCLLLLDLNQRLI